MSGMEVLVRPFQLPTNILPQRVEIPGQVDAPIVRLQIGLGGSGRTMAGSMTFVETFYCVAYQNEKRSR